MLSFRAAWPPLFPSAEPLTQDLVRHLAHRVLSPDHFFTAPGISLELDPPRERQQRWEIFRGRLLDPAHTRQEKTFEEWNLYLIESQTRSAEPLLSLKIDWHARQLHVVRGLLCHVWEGYDSGGGVFLSREATRWITELTGSVTLDEMTDAAELLDELVGQVFHAVVGANRLPLTSVETPLPNFSLGSLAYFFRTAPSDQQPLAMSEEFSLLERAKLLETFLHSTRFEEMPDLVKRLSSVDALPLLRTMLNDVSLSPWTDLVDKTLALLHALEREKRVPVAGSVDFLAAMLIQVGRHLTAYDLVTFHHRGANYPDALLLDAVLKDYLARIEKDPDLFLGPGPRERVRRRGLRQGWLLRRLHEGLPVPDAPTSPGENMRVLPPPHLRVPEEQVLHPVKRRRFLHAGDPLPLGSSGEMVLHQALNDLEQPAELREMGLALFLDRPLGIGKTPGEPDQTVLLSHRAFSRSLAEARLRFLADRLSLRAGISSFETILASLSREGVPLAEIGGQSRPGTVSVADARLAASDFVFLRTVSATAEELFRQYDFNGLWKRFSLEELSSGRGLLIVPRTNGKLTIHDSVFRPRVELIPDASQGYFRRAGRELLRAGLGATVAGEQMCVPSFRQAKSGGQVVSSSDNL